MPPGPPESTKIRVADYFDIAPTGDTAALWLGELDVGGACEDKITQSAGYQRGGCGLVNDEPPEGFELHLATSPVEDRRRIQLAHPPLSGTAHPVRPGAGGS